MNFFSPLSAYEDGDLDENNVCVGEPYEDEIFVRKQMMHGGPLICLNEDGLPVLSGIASRKSKKGSPGIFTNIVTMRKV